MDSHSSVHLRSLRIGLLVDGTQVSKYVYDLVKWAKASDGPVVITHLIVHGPSGEKSSGLRNFPERFYRSVRSIGIGRSIAKLASTLSFALVTLFDSAFLKRHPRHKDHLARFDISALVSDKLIINPILSKSRLVERFHAADIERVKDLELDLLIRCGGGILRGGILDAARFGILSFHHADNTINRGIPAGFWEVYRREDSTGFTIQLLTEELDGGNALMRGHFHTQHHYLLNQATLLERSNHYLKLLLTRIAETGALPELLPPTPYSNKLFRLPTAYECCRYIIALFARQATKAARKLGGIRYNWNVAYTFSDWRDAVLLRASRLRVPAACFLADPFVISRDSGDICFLEEFDRKQGRGRIVAYELGRDRSRRLGVAIDEPFHLSFPFLFEYRGEIYMCPETSKQRDIRIYRCDEFPLRWSLAKILMKDISAADTMLCERDSKWWMFTNVDPIEAGDHTAELSIFYADTPLSENWTPHPLNPIMVDSTRARNAGLLTDGNGQFRVSQRQGFGRYGKSTSINQIIALTETQYEEKTICVVTPDFAPGVLGTHHLHSNGKITVFDFSAFAIP